MSPAELSSLLATYDPGTPLAEARTLPAEFYVSPAVFDLERRSVFRKTWQVVGRSDQVQSTGSYVCAEIAGERVLVVRGEDGILRGFFNVCRHHAAALLSDEAGCVQRLRCPYHGWTYALDGSLRGTPDFQGVRHFERVENGLVPLSVEELAGLVLVRLQGSGLSVDESLGCLGQDLPVLGSFEFAERRRSVLACNWKVFVDNYLDGGYHVPYLHEGLDSVIDYPNYQIEVGVHHCLQRSPLRPPKTQADPQIGQVRKGNEARYYWIYPNLMINLYEEALDVNLVIPRGVCETEVVFYFYFPRTISAEQRQASIAVAQRIQDEDVAICASVQEGLRSVAYGSGRLSVRREAGEHLFHRLLHEDYTKALLSTSPRPPAPGTM